MKIDEMPLNRPWTRDEILEVFTEPGQRPALPEPCAAPSVMRLLNLRLVVALPAAWAPTR